MEKEKPRKERLAVRVKCRVTSILKKRKRKRNTPDSQLPKEISSSELPGVSYDEPEQQQDIYSPEEKSQVTQGTGSEKL